MALYLFLGGISSGKSACAEAFALKCADKLGQDRVELAVFGDEACDDPDFLVRIERHKSKRSSRFVVHNYYETPLSTIEQTDPEAILLVDELGSALSSLMIHNCHKRKECWQRLVEGLAERRGDTIVVSSETGLSLVADTSIGREFQESLGRAHCALAKRAREVFLVVAGKVLCLESL